MNVYWLDGGWIEKWSYDPPDCERERACGIFCAPTRGQAKADAQAEFNNDVEFCEWRCHLLARNLDLPRGVFEDCPEGPWDDDPELAPPEPWATVWSALDQVFQALPKERT